MAIPQVLEHIQDIAQTPKLAKTLSQLKGKEWQTNSTLCSRDRQNKDLKSSCQAHILILDLCKGQLCDTLGLVSSGNL